ncbi:pectin lyase-like superfamily protein [Striga asiatica]|uniref:pectinesterase n=1 Tax=Striga asiatica TaxID=4170 RepID=A0A5A7PMW4_STRAF|nr:pectin lyase-like superfamily protein [Striga asiatica]
MSCFRLTLQVAALILVVLMVKASNVTCHTKGIRPNRASGGKQLAVVNTTQVEYSQQQFIKWVDFMGSLKHSLFRTAKNKIFPSYTLTVDRNPLYGDFTSIQDAVDSIPLVNVLRVLIKVHAGVYNIEGAGAERTIIEWGDTAQTKGPRGQPLGTYGSATFAVNSPYFIAKNITFKNTTPVPEAGAIGKQAVALRISGDTAAFVGCKFVGAQDTLYDHNCEVHAIATLTGAVTAQGRSSILEDTGFSFVNCKVTGSGALYLGRAWGPFSRVVFAYTYMDNIIIPKGWYNWGDPSREM